MKLTDNEIRDLTSLLEQGKPIPDKYRFLIFEDKREVELVWNGKTNEVSNVTLPFQIIEQIDEPRKTGQIKQKQSDLFSFDLDVRGRQLEGWTNKLIWGDNKLILSSLKNGPLREEIEANGGLKLIYIDPPFDVGADFSMDLEIGDETFTKEMGVLEELAYRDTWGKGADSFIAMIYERLCLMKDLLTDDGSIYIHCDYRVHSFLKLILDEIFGTKNFKNEIIWKRTFNVGSSKGLAKKYPSNTDSILWYVKSSNFIFNHQFKPFSEGALKRYDKQDEKGRYMWVPLKTVSNEKLEKLRKSGEIREEPHLKYPRYKKYLDETKGIPVDNLWDDIGQIATHPSSKERLNYPTQKPENLLKRIINASSNKGDLIADFFCGSGTTLAVAEKLERKWIGADLGKFAIHITRKRMIEVQRELKDTGKDYRAFELLNLGKYERQHFIGINTDLRLVDQEKMQAKKEEDFISLILLAYKAEKVSGFNTFHGKLSSRMVVVGPVNLPVSRLFVEEVINECVEKKITKVDILGFEFEMGLFPDIQESARSYGVDLALKYIPNDVFDKRAIEKNQVKFYDVAYIEIKPHFQANNVAIEIIDFSVYYNQDSDVEADMKNNSSKLMVENGQIIKIYKDKEGHIKRRLITNIWTDWIDYWSVDFDFESKKEIISMKDEDGEIINKWTGNYVFENEWQTFRTKNNRDLELISPYHQLKSGKTKIAVKVVDIFGNDTMKIIEVNIGGK